LQEIIQDAALETGGMPDYLSKAVHREIGTQPGSGVQLLHLDAPGKLDWRTLMRRYLGQYLDVRPLYHYPPRRFPNLLGVLPGKRRSQTQANVVAIIDTSASISCGDLEAIAGELDRIHRSHAVHLVECDSEIKRVYRYRGRLREVHGGGGTDLRSPLEAKFLRGLRADLVIYFTDGQGLAPEKPPICPVVWCLTGAGEAPAEWGRLLRMA
jgi:predicted metal-dependent peptidase